MNGVPSTSISLLKSLSTDGSDGRWAEFYLRYEHAMRAFVMSRFPSLDPDDILQETMLALTKCLAGYRYDPDDKGHFRNYLMGIVKHKAMRELARRARESNAREMMSHCSLPPPDPNEVSEEAFRKAALEVAISQLMADETITPRTREVFRHVALMHEDPSAVADRFGITRNNVDQIKSRLTSRLGEFVARLCLDD